MVKLRSQGQIDLRTPNSILKVSSDLALAASLNGFVEADTIVGVKRRERD
jgi:hypothetical protein